MVKSIYDSSANAVEMRNVSKIYKLKKKDSKKSENERFFALKDITLNIPKGDVVGILGTNGSGKSTFLLFFPVFPISMAEKWKSMGNRH